MKTITNSVIYSTTLALAIAVSAAGGTLSGTGNFPLLKMAPDAAGSATAGACVGIASGASALYWNAAGLASVDGIEASASYNSWILDLNCLYLGGAMKLGPGALGASIAYLSEGEQAATLADGTANGSFRNSSYAVAAGYGLRLGDVFSVGGAAKFAGGSVGDESIIGVMFDAGAQATFRSANGNAWRLGARFANIGYAPNKTPATITLGGAYEANLGKVTLVPMISGDVKLDANSGVTAALEAKFLGQYYGRIGYQYAIGGNDAGGATGLAMGIGATFAMISVDAAYVPMGLFKSTFMFTIAAKFSLPPQPTPQGE